jgi:hypothetical protein
VAGLGLEPAAVRPRAACRRAGTGALVRHAVCGFTGWVDLAHLGVLLAFAALMCRLAIAWMTRRLID